METSKRLRAAHKRREKDGTRFVMAVGFVRPHLAFYVPQKYWDRFDREAFEMPANDKAPTLAPDVALKRGGEITNYFPVPTQGKIPNEIKQQLIHGYYASVSFVDAQVGRVLSEVESMGLFSNAIVVLWGDHGFHLGDLGIWTKHTNYEQATRIPLLIAAPGLRGGTSTKQLAESVDLFPTLSELACLPMPSGPQPMDGISLVSVIKHHAPFVRDHAYHVYPKRKLGRAIRTARYRLVELKVIGGDGGDAEYELYDYEKDPLETRNLAAEQPAVVARMRKTLECYPEPVKQPNG